MRNGMADPVRQKQPHGYEVGELAQARKMFEEHTGLHVAWGEDAPADGPPAGRTGF